MEWSSPQALPKWQQHQLYLLSQVLSSTQWAQSFNQAQFLIQLSPPTLPHSETHGKALATPTGTMMMMRIPATAETKQMEMLSAPSTPLVPALWLFPLFKQFNKSMCTQLARTLPLELLTKLLTSTNNSQSSVVSQPINMLALKPQTLKRRTGMWLVQDLANIVTHSKPIAHAIAVASLLRTTLLKTTGGWITKTTTYGTKTRRFTVPRRILKLESTIK